jgi:hypothetical protein
MKRKLIFLCLFIFSPTYVFGQFVPDSCSRSFTDLYTSSILNDKYIICDGDTPTKVTYTIILRLDTTPIDTTCFTFETGDDSLSFFNWRDLRAKGAIKNLDGSQKIQIILDQLPIKCGPSNWLRICTISFGDTVSWYYRGKYYGEIRFWGNPKELVTALEEKKVTEQLIAVLNFIDFVSCIASPFWCIVDNAVSSALGPELSFILPSPSSMFKYTKSVTKTATRKLRDRLKHFWDATRSEYFYKCIQRTATALNNHAEKRWKEESQKIHVDQRRFPRPTRRAF